MQLIPWTSRWKPNGNNGVCRLHGNRKKMWKSRLLPFLPLSQHYMWWCGLLQYTVLDLKWIVNKGLLRSTRNSAPCYVMSSMGGELRREWIHAYGASQVSVVKNPPAMWGTQRYRFDSWVGKIPWRRKWPPFLPGKIPRTEDLAGYIVHRFAKNRTWLNDGTRGYAYTYGWVPSLSTGNYHHVVNWLSPTQTKS